MIRFSLQDALLTRNASPISEAASSLDRAWEVSGPLTAFEAYDLAERRVRDIDIDYVLHSIASEEPVSEIGRSDCWVIDFRLPVRRGLARYFIRALRDEQDGSLLGSVEIEQLITPYSVEENLDSDRMDDSIDPPLPVPFRDSPEVMRYLPVTGQNDLRLTMSSALNDQGRAVWKVHFGNETRDLPMAA